MINFFTPEENEQLKILKENLTLHPTDYFFKRLKNFSEFKDISVSMLTLQWQYFSSGISHTMEAFKALGQAAYSLLTFNFFAAKEQTSESAKSAFAALTKLTLDLALLFLNTARLLSLLIVTFWPQVAVLSLALATVPIFSLSMPLLVAAKLAAFMAGSSIFSGILGYYLFKPEPSKKFETLRNMNRDIKDVRKVLKGIYAERNEIIKTLANLRASMRLSTYIDNRYQLFSGSFESFKKEILREKNERDELIHLLEKAIDSYPEIKAEKNEPGLVRNFHNDIVEHHSQVQEIAKVCFKEIGNVIYNSQDPLLLSL